LEKESANPLRQSVQAMTEAKFIIRSICVSHKGNPVWEAVNKAE